MGGRSRNRFGIFCLYVALIVGFFGCATIEIVPPEGYKAVVKDCDKGECVDEAGIPPADEELMAKAAGVGAAQKHYGRSCVDGSCASGYDLDDVTGMSDGDTAVVPADPTYGGPLYYIYDDPSSLGDSPPDVVAPGAGTGEWILQNLPIQGGGTAASTAPGARTSLGAASTSHQSTHLSGGSDAFGSRALLPSQVACNEGLTGVGNSDNELECTAWVPNAAFGCSTTTLSANNSISGELLAELTNGETGSSSIAAYELVYVETDGQLYLADADAAGKYPAMGIALETTDEDEETIILIKGCIRYDTWNWTSLGNDGFLYLDDDTAGNILLTDSGLDVGDCAQIVGWAVTADIAYFDFSRPFVIK